jgi:hypothetical protein
MEVLEPAIRDDVLPPAERDVDVDSNADFASMNTEGAASIRATDAQNRRDMDMDADVAAAEENEEFASPVARTSDEFLVDDETAKLYENALTAGGQTRALSVEAVQASLTVLGHNEQGRVVFTTVTLSSLSLDNIDTLAGFPYLQKVFLDYNELTSVAPLQACKSLVHVALANNSLTDAVFGDLAASAATLQYLDVSNNKLDRLTGVAKFEFLTTLVADGNKIETLRAEGDVGQLKSLWRLSLVGNGLARIEPGAFAECPLRALTLNKNSLGSVEDFHPLTETVSALSLEDNNIMHILAVMPFKQLSLLELAGNNIYDVAETNTLAELPLLRAVTLIGNPLCTMNTVGDAPTNADDASDVVRNDDAAIDADDDGSHNGGAAGSPDVTGTMQSHKKATSPVNKHGSTTAAVDTTQYIPSAAKVPALRVAQNAPYQPLNPVDEDAAQLLNMSEEKQYRLHVVWRVPLISSLDGIAVTPEESVEATNLVGGVDRSNRVAAQRLLKGHSGTAAQMLRARTLGN